MTVGLYAGSFDPLHLGHLSLVEKAARWCDPLYVVAVGNPDKAGGLFTLDQRRTLIEAATAHLDHVVALQWSGLVVNLAASLGVDVLVRGMGKEQNTEREMAAVNLAVSGIPTVFVPPAAGTRDLSSRIVRAEFGRRGPETVRRMVPEPVLAALVAHRGPTGASRPAPGTG